MSPHLRRLPLLLLLTCLDPNELTFSKCPDGALCARGVCCPDGTCRDSCDGAGGSAGGGQGVAGASGGDQAGGPGGGVAGAGGLGAAGGEGGAGGGNTGGSSGGGGALGHPCDRCASDGGVTDAGFDCAAFCQCTAGQTQVCDRHPGKDGVGPCRPGSQTCVVSAADRTWGACTGAVGPGPRDCSTALDVDCNGQPDNTMDGQCQCTSNEARACNTHGALDGVGVCRAGSQRCNNSMWGPCDGGVGPTAATCSSSLDNNCDGTADNSLDAGCACVPQTTRACNTHGSLDGVGLCRAGTQTCVASGSTSAWSGCSGDVGPAPRNCASSADNDCNGQPDNTVDATCQCALNATRACGTHPQDGTGLCRAGSQQCTGTSSATSWSTCSGSVGPAPRNCASSADNDCDGQPDNTVDATCQCTLNATRACDTHPQDGTGLCRAGSQACTGTSASTAWATCSGGVGPAPRNCASSADNDCNGQPDNTLDTVCQCTPGATRACGEHPGQDGIGTCTAGSQTCVSTGPSASFGTCTGSVGPTTEGCSATSADTNCNGIRGDGAGCTQTFNCDIQFDWVAGCGCGGVLRTFVSDDGNSSPLLECSNGLTPALIYLQVGSCGPGQFDHQRYVRGWVRNSSGGAGWYNLCGGFTLQ